MAKYPYVSGTAAIVKTIEQFKKSFPATVDAGTLKKFSIAPGNESYIINILRFLGLIDEEGKKSDETSDIFFKSSSDFEAGLEDLIKSAYSSLFDDHGDAAWTESRDTLATWFRVTDKTSALIGGRQASTFLTLASLAGHGEPTKLPSTTPASKPRAKKAPTKTAPAQSTAPVGNGSAAAAPNLDLSAAERVGLSVRVEVNLPAGGTPEVYDAIFASIRKNLIDQ